jgi:hypothetical protein
LRTDILAKLSGIDTAIVGGRRRDIRNEYVT